jgi:hypothetical protein
MAKKIYGSPKGPGNKGTIFIYVPKFIIKLLFGKK